MSRTFDAALDAMRNSASPMLLRVVAGLALAALACAAAVGLDPRVLDNGENVWMKPLRFCVAFGVHLLTLWWIARLTRRGESGDRWFGASAWLQAAISIGELLCITVQAARGVHSHFNYATPFDHAVFSAMGAGTGLLLAAIALMIAGMIRWPGERTPTFATIFGLSIAVVGGLVGVWMTIPTTEQRMLIDAGQRLPWVGSHLSSQASGEVLPFFAWDLHSGDWRVPHFIGLHALQALPLLAWLHRRAARTKNQVPTALWIGALAWAGAFMGAVAYTATGRSVLDMSITSGLCVAAPLTIYLAAAVAASRQRVRDAL
jgi:hypothetical protein